MAQHASSKKRIRQTVGLREDNRYYKKSTRTAIKKLREMTNKTDAQAFLPKVVSMIDRLVRRNSWHRNKAANLKSSLTKHIAGLS
jgi:small subunit ribosomal protein S20